MGQKNIQKIEDNDRQEYDIFYKGPTAIDTMKNRYSEFLLYCVTEFNQNACLVILVSSDKENAEISKILEFHEFELIFGLFGVNLVVQIFFPAQKDHSAT